MSTSYRSVSWESMRVPPVVASASSQLVSSDNASHQVPVQVFKGHKDPVDALCFYPDENKLVSGAMDGTLRIWDRKTGAVQVLGTSGHIGHKRVWDVDVSQDGKMVVSGSSDKTVRIWNGESGKMMHVFKGHKNLVRSVQFSRDLTRVVSGSDDGSVRVWFVETGELAFEPIECYGVVCCVRYSPSGDRIASGGRSVQVWDAATGIGIRSIQNEVYSLEWTADGTHLIGGTRTEVTIWNSHNGDQLRTWEAHAQTLYVSTLSLSPMGIHLATSSWGDKITFVFDISTGKQATAFKHSQPSHGIAYSPSGKFIATGCEDKKVYVWEAPAFEDPQTNESRASSFSSFLDRPAIPPAGPSRNEGIDRFWDSQPSLHHPGTLRNQQQSQPYPVFNKVKDKFAKIFIHRPTVPAQTSPVGETTEVVEVAAGKDRPYAATIYPPKFNRVQKILYTIIHCRKPEEEDEEVPANTAANSSQAAAGNTATVDSAGSAAAGPNLSPASAGKPVIHTQPKPTAAMSLSGAENRDPGPRSSPTPPKSIEMVTRGPSSIPLAMQQSPTVPAHASPQPTFSTHPLSPSVASRNGSPSTAVVTSAPLSVSSESMPLASTQSSSHNANDPVPVAVTVSPEELVMLLEFRRHKVTTEPLSGPGHDREPSIYPHASTSLPEPRSSATPNPSAIPPSSPQPQSHPYPQPSQSSVGLDPLLNVVPSLRSPSPLSVPSRHFNFPSDVHRMHVMASAYDPLAEVPRESATQPAVHPPTNDEDID